MEMLDAAAGPQAFQAFDFDTMAEWGFDFVRLPCSYRQWSAPDPARWQQVDDGVLARYLDPAIELGRQRRIHVCLSLHRVPGYCVNPPAEARDLWTDQEALDATATQWRHLAERYRGVPTSELSFDLVNEPPDDIDTGQYMNVHRTLIAAIRDVDPQRGLVVDGLAWGTRPVPEIAGTGALMSTRGYQPMELSHFRAPWIDGAMSWPTPTWPLQADGGTWDRDRLLSDVITPFRDLQAEGVGVHVGEWGVFQHTPHDVALRWMTDQLDLWRQAGWGWSLWNLRGGFGVLDSERSDVVYENFQGHQLDRAMLELLRTR